jgi:hypothetical protein
LDDYCPRERRVTNHVVVAMIEEEIRQTRCTTCDAEHAYKGGKAPRRRKAPAAAAPPSPASVVARPSVEEADVETEQPEEIPVEDAAAEPAPVQAQAEAEPPVASDVVVDEGPVHRPLIRATLPRPEGIKTERPVPEFTIRQNGGRGGNGNFRGGFASKGRGGHGVNGGGGGRPGNGPRFGRGPQGRGGQQGRGGPLAGGFGRGPKKRSR